MKYSAIIFALFFFCTQSHAQYYHWLQKIGGSGADVAWDVAVDSKGNSYVVGQVDEEGSTNCGTQPLVYNTAGISDIFLAKIDTFGKVVWLKLAGGLSADAALAVTIDNQDYVYVTGYFRSKAKFGGVEYIAQGGKDMFAAKYDTNGTIEWVYTAGGVSDDVSHGIAVDSTGNVYLTGYYIGAINLAGQNLTSIQDTSTEQNFTKDFFLLKLNAAGQAQWVRTGGGHFKDYGKDVTVNKNGVVVVTGQFADTCIFTTGSVLTGGGNTIFIASFDGNGNELWIQRVRGGALGYVGGIVMNVDGTAFYITGNFLLSIIFESTGVVDQSIISQYVYNIFIAKYSIDGNLQWKRSEGSDSYVSSQNVACDGYGNVFVCGFFECTFSSFSDLTGTTGTFQSLSKADGFWAKYNGNGQLVQRYHDPGVGNNYFYGIAVNKYYDIFDLLAAIPVAAGVFEQSNYSVRQEECLNNYYWWWNYGFGWDQRYCVSGYNFYNFDNTTTYSYEITSTGTSNIVVKRHNCGNPRYRLDKLKLRTAHTENNWGSSYIDNDTLDTVVIKKCIPFYEEYSQCSWTDGFEVKIYDWGLYYNFEWSMFDYSWSIPRQSRNFINIDTSGTFILTRTTKDGCFTAKDTVVLIIDITANYKSYSNRITNTTWGSGYYLVCPGDTAVITVDPCILNLTQQNPSVTYKWLGQGLPPQGLVSDLFTVTQDTTVYFTLNSGNGCPADTLQYRFSYLNPQPLNLEITFLNDTTCIGNAISLYVCDSTLYDSLGYYPILQGSGTVTGPNGFSSSLYYENYRGNYCYVYYFYPTISGIYNVSATVPNSPMPGCADYYTESVSKYITVIPYPNVDIINPYTIICPGDTVLLSTIGSGGTLSWYYDSTCIATQNINCFEWWNTKNWKLAGTGSTLSAMLPGIYYVVVNNGYCSVWDTVTLWRHKPDVSVSPSYALICPGGNVTLCATGGIGYQWLPGNQNTACITVNSADFYSCMVTYTGGCMEISPSINVEEYSVPEIYADPPEAYLCSGVVTLSVNASPSSAYAWFKDGQPQFVDLPIYVANVLGNYSCEVTSCSITSTLAIPVTLPPPLPLSITAEPPEPWCLGDSVLLTAVSPADIFLWSNQNISPSIYASAPGTQNVKVWDEFGCQYSDSITISMTPLDLTISPNAKVYFCTDTTVQLSFSGTPGNMQWYHNGTAIPGATASSVSVQEVGQYVLHLLTNNGCDVFIRATTLVMDTVPEMTITIPDTVCAWDPTQFSVDILIPNNVYKWTFTSIDTTFNQSSATAQVKFQKTGNYSVSMTCTSPSGCSKIVSDSIKVIFFPEWIYIEYMEACIGEPVPLVYISSDTLAEFNFKWTVSWPGDSLKQVFLTERPVFIPDEEGNYSVELTITNAEGCNHTEYGSIYADGMPVKAGILPVDTVCPGNFILFQTNIDTLWEPLFKWQITGPNSFASSWASPKFLFSVAGNYTVTVMAVNQYTACKDTLRDTLLFTIGSKLPAFSLDLPDSVCTGPFSISAPQNDPALYYNWQITGPQSFDFTSMNITPVFIDTGKYTIMLTVSTSSGSCGTSDTFALKVVEVPSFQLPQLNPVCTGETAYFSLSNLLANFRKNWVIKMNADTLVDTLVTDNDFSYLFKNPGVFQITLIILNDQGCSDSSSTSITVRSDGIPVNAGILPVDTVCPGNFILFQTNIDTLLEPLFNWQITGPISFASSLASPKFLFSVAGNYTVTVTVVNQDTTCNDTLRDTLLFTIGSKLPAFSLELPDSVCTGPFSISAPQNDPALYYNWQITGPQSFVFTSMNITPVFIDTGKYTIMLTVSTSSGSCGTADTFALKVVEVPSFQIPQPNPVCAGETAYFSLSNSLANFRKNWVIKMNTDTLVDTLVLDNDFSYLFKNSGVFQITVILLNDLGCSDTSGTSITVRSVPVAPVIKTVGTVCVGNKLVLTTDSLSGVNYSWTGPNGFKASGQTVLIPQASSVYNGTYSLSVFSNGCQSPQAVVQVAVQVPPTLDVSPLVNKVCPGERAVFNIIASEIVVWVPDKNLDFSIPGQVSVLTLHSTQYTLSATDSARCSVQIVAEVIIIQDDPDCAEKDSTIINTPNVFTPNSDGVNDRFYIRGLPELVSFTLLIFDRWGVSVYVNSNKGNEYWDGTFNGNPVPDGVYAYTIQFQIPGNSIQLRRKGFVTLLR